MQEQIIQLLRQQDSTAISQLHDAYGGALFGVAMRIVSCKQVAEQVLQDTFVKVWRNAAHYDESKGRLFTWMMNITRNTAIDATRSAQYRNYQKIDNIDSLRHEPGGEVLNPDSIGLREMVQKMDDKHKVLINLVYFNGYTHEAVSEEIGVPVGTVKTRLRVAMTELRKNFD